jgi:hypothetical protein
MADECMGGDTLIFLSDGQKHSRLRKLFTSAVHGFHVSGDTVFVKPLEPVALNASNEDVQRVLVRNLFNRLFEEVPSEEALDTLMEYYTYACVLIGRTKLTCAVYNVQWHRTYFSR